LESVGKENHACSQLTEVHLRTLAKRDSASYKIFNLSSLLIDMFSFYCIIIYNFSCDHLFSGILLDSVRKL